MLALLVILAFANVESQNTLITSIQPLLSPQGDSVTEVITATIKPPAPGLKYFQEQLNFDSPREAGAKYSLTLGFTTAHLECKIQPVAWIPERVMLSKASAVLTDPFISKSLRAPADDLVQRLGISVQRKEGSAGIVSNSPDQPMVPGQDEAFQLLNNASNNTSARRRRMLLQAVAGDSGNETKLVLGDYAGSPSSQANLSLCNSVLPTQDLQNSVGNSTYACPLAACIANLGGGDIAAQVPQNALALCQGDDTVDWDQLAECIMRFTCRVSVQCSPVVLKNVWKVAVTFAFLPGGQAKIFMRFQSLWAISPVMAIDFARENFPPAWFKQISNVLSTDSLSAASDCVDNVHSEIEAQVVLVQESYRLQQIVFWQAYTRDFAASQRAAQAYYEEMVNVLNDTLDTRRNQSQEVQDRIRMLNDLNSSLQEILGLVQGEVSKVQSVVGLGLRSAQAHNETLTGLFEDLARVGVTQTSQIQTIKLLLQVLQYQGDSARLHVAALLDKSSLSSKSFDQLALSTQELLDKTQAYSMLIKTTHLNLRKAAQSGLQPFVKDRGEHPRETDAYVNFGSLSVTVGEQGQTSGNITRYILIIRCDALQYANDLGSKHQDYKDMDNLIGSGPEQCTTRTCKCWGRGIVQQTDRDEALAVFRADNDSFVGPLGPFYNRSVIAGVLQMPEWNTSTTSSSGGPWITTRVVDMITRAAFLTFVNQMCSDPSTSNSSQYIRYRVRVLGAASNTILMSANSTLRLLHCKAGIENLQSWVQPGNAATLNGTALPLWILVKMSNFARRFEALSARVKLQSEGRAPVPMSYKTYSTRYTNNSVLTSQTATDYVGGGSGTTLLSTTPKDQLPDSKSDKVLATRVFEASLLTTSPNMVPVSKVFACHLVQDVQGVTTTRSASGEVLSVSTLPSVDDLQTFGHNLNTIPTSFHVVGYPQCWSRNCPTSVSILDPVTNAVTGTQGYALNGSFLGSDFVGNTSDIREDGYARFLYDVPENMISLGRFMQQRRNGITCLLKPADAGQTVGPRPELAGQVYQMPMMTWDEWNEYNIGDLEPEDCSLSPTLFRQALINQGGLGLSDTTRIYLDSQSNFVCSGDRRVLSGLCTILDNHYLELDTNFTGSGTLRIYPKNYFIQVTTHVDLWKEALLNTTTAVDLEKLKLVPQRNTAQGLALAGCPDSIDVFQSQDDFTHVNVLYTQTAPTSSVLLVTATPCKAGDSEYVVQVLGQNIVAYATTTLSVPGCPLQRVNVSVSGTTCLVWVSQSSLLSLTTIQEYEQRAYAVEQDRLADFVRLIAQQVSDARDRTFAGAQLALDDIFNKSVSSWTNETQQRIQEWLQFVQDLKANTTRALTQSVYNYQDTLNNLASLYLSLQRSIDWYNSSNSTALLDSLNQRQAELDALRANESEISQIVLQYSALAKPLFDNVSSMGFWVQGASDFDLNNLGALLFLLDKVGFPCQNKWDELTLKLLRKQKHYVDCDETDWLDQFSCGDLLWFKYFWGSFLMVWLLMNIWLLLQLTKWCTRNQKPDSTCAKCCSPLSTKSCPSGSAWFRNCMFVLFGAAVSIPILGFFL